ncbi:hypothetical protein Tco_0343492 [Tanacetum coccineum]
MVPHPRSPTQTPIVDETASTGVDVRYGGATTTVTGLEAGHGNVNIDKTPTMPYDSPLLRVNTLRSDEGSMTLQELMVFCTTLSKKVESLEADLKQTKKVYGAAYTKLIMKVKKLEKTVKTSHSRRRAKIGEDQPEDQLGVLSAAKVLADATKTNVHTYTRRRRAVSTGSSEISTAEESVSTAGASIPVSTAGMVQKVNISIPLPVVVKDKEWENIRARVEADEELSKRLQAEERNKYSEVDQAKMLVDLINQIKKYFATQKAEAKRNKPMTQAQQRNYMINYIKHIGKTEDRGRASELAAGSSQATIIDSAEVGSSKRVVEAELDHKGSKRQKTNKASGSVQEQPEEKEKELSQEDLQQMMMVVPVEEVYVEAL